MDAPTLGPVEQQTLAVLISLRSELGREPETSEVSARLGLRDGDARPRIKALGRLALPYELTPRQEQCLRAIAALEKRLGRSPSTREVSDEMGLGPSGSRFHINRLVKLGLVTPPEVRLVLSVTPAGRAYVP